MKRTKHFPSKREWIYEFLEQFRTGYRELALYGTTSTQIPISGI